MNTDDLRTKYGKAIHFNCKDGDEAFTNGYVLWLEKQLLLYSVSNNEVTLNCLHEWRTDKFDCYGYPINRYCELCGEEKAIL